MTRAAWELTDEEHAARVEKTRSELIGLIMAEYPQVAEVTIEDGTWRAVGHFGKELARAQSVAGLRAQLPFCG